MLLILLQNWRQQSLAMKKSHLKVFLYSAEIVSPRDLAEDVITKAQEYLESRGEEVWLVFPENKNVV